MPVSELKLMWMGVGIALPLKLIVFHMGRLHRGWWNSVGVLDVGRIVTINSFASIVVGIPIVIFIGRPFPRSIYILDLGLCIATIAGVRILLRAYRELAWLQEAGNSVRKPVLIYGAGLSGISLLREIRTNPKLGRRVVGFLDDDPHKRREIVDGITVLGGGRDVIDIVESFRKRGTHIEEILIAMPSVTGLQMREAVANCRAAGVVCKTLPGISELLTGKALGLQIRDISVEDLLGRAPVELHEEKIRETIGSQVVMVTGAGGSIGSELCRQIAGYDPKKLVLVDRAESDLFRIDLDLHTRFPGLPIVAEVGDIGNSSRIEEMIKRHGVEIIFHAAAYKHVPLMEEHPLEAAHNNICGTWNLAKTAYANRVKKFVMISSDKAVNPTNIMGVTKRISELIVSSFPTPAQGGHTRFVSVRFGNVLASNGSVVPIFQRQIAAGGPVTVTHPEVRRFFMTLREAVQLVLQASTMGKGSEVFVLNMGEAVKIVDLARNMIRMAGRIPDEEIEIRFVGLRPGEKLYEELITQGEHIVPTHHQQIRIFQGPSVSAESMEQWISKLTKILLLRDEVNLIRHLASLVPEYQADVRWVHAFSHVKTDYAHAGRL
jgi:FlaA1/EpsC-like NDP-sugar epimerase